MIAISVKNIKDDLIEGTKYDYIPLAYKGTKVVEIPEKVWSDYISDPRGICNCNEYVLIFLGWKLVHRRV